ncbi:hypothetical protein AWH63_10650 [Marinobacter sp. C18]|uniref:hypothetical protein n=1 Tax=Marinobacter sp. C18 TaxID=1772288 RepID=UPI000948D881|nr:hypothetical protein [Marinobacter sp. C18]OLF81990.1 hypothetical protein AWH63_10650 [Marinobacter sp. C18]
MRRARLTSAVALAVAVSASPQGAQAAAGYAAGFKTGFELACSTCAGAVESAFSAIRASITISEQAIGRAINDGPYYTPAPIGFPALQTQINVSSADKTQKILQAITATTNKISDSITEQVAVRKAVQEDQKRQQIPALQGTLDSHGGCQSLQYGRVMDYEPRSSLGWGYQYVTSGKFVDEDGEGVGNSVAPPSASPTDAESVSATISDINTRAKQVTNSEFQGLKERAEAEGIQNPVMGNILDPSILYRSDKRTFSIEPDDHGMTDDERADYLIQYLMADSPTHADTLSRIASTPAALNAAVDSQIHNMEFGMSMAAVDNIIRLRRPRGSAAPDEFLADAMGIAAPETTSTDDFWHGITHYRQQDTQWMARTMIDDNYALAQQVQMEAEHLALKYQRWKTMRSNTLIMAQIAANIIEKENGSDR